MNHELTLEQKEYDQRQYRMMIQLLDAFEKGNSQLDHFISNLVALLRMLNDSDREWEKKYYEEWQNCKTQSKNKFK